MAVLNRVKVVVTAHKKFWCAGHCFEAGEQTVVLEDTPGRSLSSKLAELDAASRGRDLEMNGLERGMPAGSFKSYGVLTYRIIDDPTPIIVDAPAPLAAPALEMTAGPGEPPSHEPEPEVDDGA